MPRNKFVPIAFLLVACSAVFGGAAPVAAQEQFARPTIDLGCVVSDVEAAVKFYTEAIGFKELEGFRVPKGFATRAGLTDEQPLSIRVLVLRDVETATKLKLMEVPGAESKPSDNTTIHSQLGFSYLTIYVEDMDAAVKRLNQADAKIVGEGPVELPGESGAGVYLTVVRDPDGNLVELVGPKND